MDRTPASQWPRVALLQLDLCPRCGGRHAKVEYRRFELGDPQFTHWAYCETTGEPLFLNMAVPKSRVVPSKFRIKFAGTGKKAEQPSNPDYPDGVDITLGETDPTKKCKATLPYPADEIGAWQVECSECGSRLACTAAGRPDDPRSIELPCRRQ